MDCRRLIALCMVLAYLLLPMDGLAQFQPFASSPERVAATALHLETAQDHCPGCPCGDEGHGTGRCDASCLCCSCFAPLPQAIAIDFIPVVASLIPFEPFRALPQVFLPIFVPPQNLA